jgi:DNA-binding transcriptional MerR regulator
MRIGELAEQSGVTAKALRHYERVGLLVPARTESGYRDYPTAALGRVQFILAGRRVGLSLRELRQILDVRDQGDAPCTRALALIDKRLREVQERIASLSALQAELSAVAEAGRLINPADCDEACICTVINRQQR